MRSTGIALLITGLMLSALSGLEKILIYLSWHDRAHEWRTVKSLTPGAILRIADLTLWAGILTFFAGVALLLNKQLGRLFAAFKASMKEADDHFNREHRGEGR